MTEIDKSARRVRRAKTKLRIERLKQEVLVLNAGLTEISARRAHEVAQLKDELASAVELASESASWRRSAESYSAQLAIARDQLVANGIEPDRRIM